MYILVFYPRNNISTGDVQQPVDLMVIKNGYSLMGAIEDTHTEKFHDKGPGFKLLPVLLRGNHNFNNSLESLVRMIIWFSSNSVLLFYYFFNIYLVLRDRDRERKST